MMLKLLYKFLKLIYCFFIKDRTMLLLNNKIKIYNSDFSEEKMKKINEMLYDFKEALKIRIVNLVMDRLSYTVLKESGFDVNEEKLKILQRNIVMAIESDVEYVSSSFIERINR